MTATSRLTGGIALALLPLSASAEVTADDVWANLQAYARAFGGSLTAETARTGDTLTVNDLTATFTFPQGSGEAVIKFSGLAMMENGDGTVTLLYADNPSVKVSGMITGEGDGSATLTLKPGSYSITASGEPGDLRYDSTFSDVVLALGEITSSEPDDFAADESRFDLTFDGWTSTARVTEGDLLSVTGETAMQPYRYDMRMKIDTLEVEQSGSAGGSEVGYSFALPAEGADLFALGAAFDRGMFLDVTSRIEGQESRSRMVTDGITVQSQDMVQQAGSGHLRIDATAFEAQATVDGMEMAIRQEFMPFPFAADVGQLALDVRLPMSASPDPQPFHYGFDLSGLRLGADIWAQFDPSKQLPRDPADLNFALSGEVIADVDLADVGQWQSAMLRPLAFPYRPTRLSLEAFSASALKVLAEASGVFTFDWADMTTLPGSPRPEGEGELTITGMNALIELLISAGILTSDDAMGLRMGMAMFTLASGPDQVSSTLKVDASGGMFVNGQRIR